MSSENTIYPIDDLEIDSFEELSTKNDEWVSEDKKRKLVVIVMGGGVFSDWKGVWLKDIILSSTDSLVASELMRVQLSKNADSKEVLKTVFVDVFEFQQGQGIMNSKVYCSATGGKLEEMGKYSLCGEKDTSTEEYIEAFVEEDVRTVQDLPEQIDVDETIRLFMEQLEERNFSMPVLVPA